MNAEFGYCAKLIHYYYKIGLKNLYSENFYQYKIYIEIKYFK